MSAKKNVLIVTDGTETVDSIAASIGGKLSDFKVKITNSQEFEGTDLLPADIFFLGCEKASPESFSYLEDILSHINLASRKCGIFSTNEKAINYLRKITKDCEADMAEPLLSESITRDSLEKWVKTLTAS